MKNTYLLESNYSQGWLGVLGGCSNPNGIYLHSPEPALPS